MTEDVATEEQTADEPAAAKTGSFSGADWIALPLISVFALVIRIIHLSYPPTVIFDETYYAKDACWYLYSNASKCMLSTAGEQTYVHPPLGKWLIAIGIRLFGMNSYGWRISAVVAGTLTVALLYLLARKILRSTLGAVVTSGLLAIDILHFVQSRVAMLDGFVPLFAIAMILFIVYDRDRLLRIPQETDGDPPEGKKRRWRPHLLDRPWRLAAGIAGGAAIASKWSGGLLVIAAIFLTIAWELSARRKVAGVRILSPGFVKVMAITLLEEGPSILLWLIVVPAAVYVATYIGRLDGPILCQCYSTTQNWFVRFWNDQKWMWHFQKTLTATHNYESPPWSWMLLKRPVSYFYCGGTQCSPAVGTNDVQEIMAFGNPFVWWASGLALLFVGWRWIKEHNFFGPEGLILAGFVFAYIPWFYLAKGRPAVFIFYFIPAVPFMCLALGYVATQIGRSWEAKAAVAIFAAASIGLFAFYYPLTAGDTLPHDSWNRRIWIFQDCGKPSTVNYTTTITTTEGGSPTVVPTTTPTDTGAIPPGYGEGWTQGWCWI